ncbi:uncharacterized protein [Antedon mediterranea]|uniref:uncharacterized protein isoform X2 n=1 Tax=Antedon mediterranea TaxID=105859 RepID=UPI003AF9090B
MTSNTVSLVELVDLSLGTPEVVNYHALRRLMIVIVENLHLGDLKTELSQSDLDSVDLSGSKSKEIENKLSKLETQIESLNALPSNENLLERTRSSSESVKPVSEMWQLMQLQKKVIANEEGISKLMSMMEHMMSEFNDLKSQTSDWKSELDNYKSLIKEVEDKCNSADERIRKLEESSSSNDKIQELQSLLNDFNNKLNVWPDPSTIVTWPAMEDALKGIHTEPVSVYDNTSQTVPVRETPEPQSISPSPIPTSRPGTASSVHSAHPSREIQEILKNIGELRGDHDQLDNRVKNLEETMPNKADLSVIEEMLSNRQGVPEDLANQLASLKERLEAISKNQVKASVQDLHSKMKDSSDSSQAIEEILAIVNETKEQLSAEMDARFQHLQQLGFKDDILQLLDNKIQMISSEFTSQLRPISKSIASIRKQLNSLEGITSEISPVVTPVGELMDSESITNMQGVLLQLQAEVEKLNSTLIHLVDEHTAKQKHIDALYTYIDRLQEFKADKEHVIMEIDVKADKRALDNKISRAQFEGTVDELSKNLQEVMHKISGHQNAWEDAVSEMKVDIDNKLDRMELDPLKTYLDKRIKVASAKMVPKESDLIGEEAAGFRKPLMQKFNCISCDRPLDIATHGPIASLPESKALPGNRSGRPYTTFELEQIRAAQKNTKPGKNVQHYQRSLFTQQVAKQRKQDLLAYLVHFSQEGGGYTSTSRIGGLGTPQSFISTNYQDVPAYFAASRSCGGTHTLTYPHRRTNRIPHLNQGVQVIQEFVPAVKVEHEIQGQDGHIYKGRQDTDRLPDLATPKSAKSSRSTRPVSARQASRSPSAKQNHPRPLSGRSSKSPRPPSSPEGYRVVEAQLPSACMENLVTEQSNQIPAEKPLEQN